MNVDFLIVGHGLAGATLAWHLRWLGKQVAVLDQGRRDTASRVAAGLITPITGKRNTVSHRFADFWSTALPFYRRVEATTGRRFLHTDRTMRRCDEESHRWGDQESRRYLAGVTKLEAPYRGRHAFELADAARLCVPSYLDASQTNLESEGRFYQHKLDLAAELALDQAKVRIACLDIDAAGVVFCQGFDAVANQLFSELPFEPAKGEILELLAPSLHRKPTLLSDVWIIPTDEAHCLVGATYDREFENELPTDRGRQELLTQLADEVDASFRVVGHRAAVRPIMHGRLPQFGVSPADPRLGFFNGLGSKGALRAPETARQFANYLANDMPVDPEFWYEPSTAPSIRLTTVAHGIVSATVAAGDAVIDATAGNGFDTVFLSQLAGPTGRVYALDVQAEAISRTATKLQSQGIECVQLVLGSHAELAQHIPAKLHGTIAAVMFNLGYLPRGQKDCTTNAQTTILALDQAIELLREDGVITIIAYTGHANGLVETRAIEEWLSDARVTRRYQVERPPTKPGDERPRLYVLRRKVG